MVKQIKHEFKVKVYHADTDCYNVVWHGAYFKWLEAGRVEVLESVGIRFAEMEEMGIKMPVTEINIRYKHFGKLYDNLSIATTVEEVGRTHLTFKHEITNIDTGKLIVSAKVTGVTTDKQGKLFREIPTYVRDKLETAVL